MQITRTARFRELGWQPYVWLVYSIPYLYSSFNARLSLVETAAMLIGYAVFLVAYVASYMVRGPRILWPMLVMNALGIIFMPTNPGAGSFLIYAAAMPAHGFAVKRAVWVLAAQVVLGTMIAAAQGWPSIYFVMVAVISALIGAVTIQAAVTEAGHAKLRIAHAEVERLAKLAERERIARDLHDVIGHTLSLVVLKTELAQKLIVRDAERAMAEMADVERIARGGLAEVRQAITGYRSSGLADELEHVRETLVAAGIEATIEAGSIPLPPDQETALSLALREATTNVIRHAAATKCHIRFYAQDTSVLMEVADNGRGGEAPFGNGLTGMRERIQALGGVLTREAGQGTRLLIKLPV
ncbi:MAG TPA: sensor histidine kinase [Vicinamibacterales bacterium]|nr:sensor histidine kinase [Vicinamibacterales bacterium]